jgi:hypothetical protein
VRFAQVGDPRAFIGPGLHHPSSEVGPIWLACSEPERPPDERVVYHFIPQCEACQIARDAATRGGYDLELGRRRV